MYVIFKDVHHRIKRVEKHELNEGWIIVEV